MSSSQTSIISTTLKYVNLKVSAPGKVILHGEHAVVYGKLAVAASLGMRTHVELMTTDPIMGIERFDVLLTDIPYHGSFELDSIKELLETPTPTVPECNLNLSKPECLDHDALIHIVRTFLDKSAATLGNATYTKLTDNERTAVVVLFYLFKAIMSASGAQVALEQMVVRVKSELPLGCGTGSSAAYAVALAAAFMRFAIDAGSVDELGPANVSKWAYQAERIIHGTPSGVDNSICTHGNWLKFVKGGSMDLLKLTNSRFKVILVNTLVPRNTKALVEQVGVLRQKHPRIIDAVLDIIDMISRDALTALMNINGGSGDVLAYYEKLQELSDMNHHMLQALSVSHPRIEQALEIMAANGLKGKLTGAGGGGCALCMVPPYVDREVVEKTLKLLHTQNFSAHLTDLGGEGVRFDD